MLPIQKCWEYLQLAIKELGVHETVGSAATARIIEYDKHTSLKATSDEVAWCSSFVNFIVDTAGDKGTGSAAAISWQNWGSKVDSPVPGCIVVIKRNDPDNPNAAHVTFYEKNNGDDTVCCIGGNQSNMVKRSNYQVEKVLCYRIPR